MMPRSGRLGTFDSQLARTATATRGEQRLRSGQSDGSERVSAGSPVRRALCTRGCAFRCLEMVEVLGQVYFGIPVFTVGGPVEINKDAGKRIRPAWCYSVDVDEVVSAVQAALVLV